MDAISLKNLAKYYGKDRGVIDLNLTVKKGEFFGFIGPNGAGKSTTIRLLLGLIAPTSGTISIFGRPLSDNLEAILSDAGYLPSEVFFYPGMKVRDVLKLSADLRGKNCLAAARSLCERLKLDMDRKVEDLSFGNRKKAAIVCALQHNPSLLILDEPTSGLDPLMQKEFFRILQERNDEGVTILLSSHILSEVQQYCSRAAILRQGRIVACGQMEQLMYTSAKKVMVNGQIDLKSSGEVQNLQQNKDTSTFLYYGTIQNLLSILQNGVVKDFTVTEPDLEEIFLHFYEREEAA